MTAAQTITLYCDATACYRTFTSHTETIPLARLDTAGDWEVIDDKDFCPRHRSPRPNERAMTSSDIVSAQRDERQDAVHPGPGDNKAIVPIGSRWAGFTGNIMEVAEVDGDRVRVFMVDDPEDTCWEEADKWAKYMTRL